MYITCVDYSIILMALIRKTICINKNKKSSHLTSYYVLTIVSTAPKVKVEHKQTKTHHYKTNIFIAPLRT